MRSGCMVGDELKYQRERFKTLYRAHCRRVIWRGQPTAHPDEHDRKSVQFSSGTRAPHGWTTSTEAHFKPTPPGYLWVRRTGKAPSPLGSRLRPRATVKCANGRSRSWIIVDPRWQNTQVTPSAKLLMKDSPSLHARHRGPGSTHGIGGISISCSAR